MTVRYARLRLALEFALIFVALPLLSGWQGQLLRRWVIPQLLLLAGIFLGERLEWPQLLGIALILGAVGLPRLLAGDERHTSKADVLTVGEPVADG